MVVLSSSSLTPAADKRFSSLETMLVDCKILSFQLCSNEPYLWALQELSGYDPQQKLPFYRMFPCQSMGLFRKSETGECHISEIPHHLLNEKDKSHLCFYQARLPLTDYFGGQQLDGPILWPAAQVSYYQDELLADCICERAWQELTCDIKKHLMAGIKHVFTAYLLRASALLAHDRPSARQYWSSNHDGTRPAVLRHIELGNNEW